MQVLVEPPGCRCQRPSPPCDAPELLGLCNSRTLMLRCRFFIGTSVSTFSFRIHEEREILGFDPKTTYNRFCGDEEKACEQPTHWKITY